MKRMLPVLLPLLLAGTASADNSYRYRVDDDLARELIQALHGTGMRFTKGAIRVRGLSCKSRSNWAQSYDRPDFGITTDECKIANQSGRGSRLRESHWVHEALRNALAGRPQYGEDCATGLCEIGPVDVTCSVALKVSSAKGRFACELTPTPGKALRAALAECRKANCEFVRGHGVACRPGDEDGIDPCERVETVQLIGCAKACNLVKGHPE